MISPNRCFHAAGLLYSRSPEQRLWCSSGISTASRRASVAFKLQIWSPQFLGPWIAKLLIMLIVGL